MFFIRSSFEKTFGFRPTMLLVLRGVEQERVKKHLTVLASAYAGADSSERALVSKLDDLLFKGNDFGKTLKVRADGLRYLHSVVADAKKSFWRAQRLAKREGYEVFPKYTDYLHLDPIRSK
jgi:hypothetical protein